MDRNMLRRRLAVAEAHLAGVERSLARQRNLIEELESGGHDSEEARRLLRIFEQLQAAHIADRDRLGGELSE
jgi:hypothetical protein